MPCYKLFYVISCFNWKNKEKKCNNKFNEKGYLNKDKPAKQQYAQKNKKGKTKQYKDK